ncbi:MAG: hypothetical protein K0S07_662 [Chlamydiales bacterium]|jgi:hypothetical protein|nr:hypothetical protein [Chlamydiales bacterium]
MMHTLPNSHNRLRLPGEKFAGLNGIKVMDLVLEQSERGGFSDFFYQEGSRAITILKTRLVAQEAFEGLLYKDPEVRAGYISLQLFPKVAEKRDAEGNLRVKICATDGEVQQKLFIYLSCREFNRYQEENGEVSSKIITSATSAKNDGPQERLIDDLKLLASWTRVIDPALSQKAEAIVKETPIDLKKIDDLMKEMRQMIARLNSNPEKESASQSLWG